MSPVSDLRRTNLARGPLLACALCALALLAAAPAARASYDPVGSGSARLSLIPSFRRLLASHGVSLGAGAPAKGNGASGAFSLPAAGGSIDPTLGKGELETQGTLVFRRGRLAVPLRHLTVKTKRQPLIAKVGGGQLKLAAAKKLSFKRRGFESEFFANGLRISAKLATRLSKKLHLRGVFVAGQPLGNLRFAAAPQTTAILPSGRLSLAPAPAFLAKLESLFVSVNPVSPAERQAGPLFTMPFIPAGTIAPDGGSGVPRTGGSIEFLQLGAGQIFWHELWFDLAGHQLLAEVDEEPTPTFPGKLGQVQVASLDLSTATISAEPGARTVSVSGAGLALNATMAASFNEAFAKPQGKADVFHSGEAIGTVSFTAQGQ